MNQKLLAFFQEVSRLSGRSRSYEELAAILGVSTRSIRNYCAALSDYASAVGAGAVLNQQPSGVTFIGTREQVSLIESTVGSRGFYEYRLSYDERILAISLMLLGAQRPVTVTHICEVLFVSRATVLNDMERVKAFFQQFGVALHPQSNHGYLLDITEQKRREVTLAACLPHLRDWDAPGRSAGVLTSLLEDNFHLSELLPQVKQIAQDAENEYGVTIGDMNFKHTVLAIALTCRRLKDGFLLEHFSSDRSFAPNTSVNKIARSILIAAELGFGVHYTQSEVDFMALRLYTSHFDKIQNFEHSLDVHLYLGIHRFLTEVEKELGCELSGDQRLLIMLTRHIQGMQTAADGENDLPEALVSDYREYYDVVFRHIGILEDCLGHSCSHGQVCSILLHIVSAIERQTRLDSRPRVCVVCHIGIGTAHYLADRLRETFNLDVAGITAIHKLPEVLKTDSFDLLVSTVPLELDGVDYVRISPNLADADILAVQAALTRARRRKRTRPAPASPRGVCSLSGLIRPEHIVLDVPCTDWRDAVRVGATPLVAQGDILPEYVDSIIRSVQTNGPYFVFTKYVALAHAAPADGVRRFCCSIYRPEKPVSFHHPANDPVKLLVTVGITDISTQVDYISALMNTLSDENNLNRILAARDAGQIVAVFADKL